MAKVRVLNGLRVEIEPPHGAWGWRQPLEQQARNLERWAREFEAFIRDHRSQDPVSLTVIRDHEDQCSHCGRAWEEDADGPLCCDAALAEWNEAKEKAA